MTEIARLLSLNQAYAAARANVADPRPSRHLAVVTCMDARIDVFPRVAHERSIWNAGIERIGGIPMDPAVATSGENGTPIVLADQTSIIAKAFGSVADAVTDALSPR